MQTYVSELTDREKEMIMTAAVMAVDEAMQKNNNGNKNYYRIVEKLLYNYCNLKSLVENEKEYLTVEQQSKSKSVIVKTATGHTYKTDEDVAEEIARERLLNYEKLASNFREVDRVIKLFTNQKEFIVIRMYYFNEDVNGNQRHADTSKQTWEEITSELADKGILKDEKTARRWRNKLINDMAICFFGKAAAT